MPQFCLLFYAILQTWRPKGGPMAQCPPLNTPLISYLEQSQHAAKCQELANEVYSKRLNLLIHGLDENEVWEKKETTLLIFKNFVQEGLNLNLLDINIIDIHRLLQRPISKQGIRLI